MSEQTHKNIDYGEYTLILRNLIDDFKEPLTSSSPSVFLTLDAIKASIKRSCISMHIPYKNKSIEQIFYESILEIYDSLKYLLFNLEKENLEKDEKIPQAIYIDAYQNKYPDGTYKDESSIRKRFSEPLIELVSTFLYKRVLDGQISLGAKDSESLRTLTFKGTNIGSLPYILDYYNYLTKPLLNYPSLSDIWYSKADYVFYILNHNNSIFDLTNDTKPVIPTLSEMIFEFLESHKDIFLLPTISDNKKASIDSSILNNEYSAYIFEMLYHPIQYIHFANNYFELIKDIDKAKDIKNLSYFSLFLYFQIYNTNYTSITSLLLKSLNETFNAETICLPNKLTIGDIYPIYYGIELFQPTFSFIIYNSLLKQCKAKFTSLQFSQVNCISAIDIDTVKSLIHIIEEYIGTVISQKPSYSYTHKLFNLKHDLKKYYYPFVDPKSKTRINNFEAPEKKLHEIDIFLENILSDTFYKHSSFSAKKFSVYQNMYKDMTLDEKNKTLLQMLSNH